MVMYRVCNVGRVKRIWYLSPMRAKVQESLRIRAVLPEPSLLAQTSSESRGTFRQKARSLAPLNGWACAVKICHDGMLEDTNSLDGAHVVFLYKVDRLILSLPKEEFSYGIACMKLLQLLKSLDKKNTHTKLRPEKCLTFNIGIKHDFLCINICWALRDLPRGSSSC